MKIVEQSAAIVSFPDNVLSVLEVCGRTAYQSQPKGDDEAFIKPIVSKGHLSVIEHASMTVRFVTDRGVSHELVRHRLASFTQESTRYCNYADDKFGNELTFIHPVWIDPDLDMRAVPTTYMWWQSMCEAENFYFDLLRLGWTPQQARAVLPNSLKTEIVMTANLREWRHVFQLRAIEKAAHPQMRALMIPLYEKCRELCPVIFDMGVPE